MPRVCKYSVRYPMVFFKCGWLVPTLGVSRQLALAKLPRLGAHLRQSLPPHCTVGVVPSKDYVLYTQSCS